ncbi:patatin-like phospholipase family protein [Trichococcus ilyis]|uniref:Acyl transferase/acyl hydrolase/lysophospholipase n=1 Tax=Trichococcus ilyis TaxID=640938 RepID=A0A143Y698_9LACT|nr:patatin family protein [Trichococcus ilyis]CZQ81229.1 acyl transferase/acyl hydrolase/lysophospholipase [Trichococcus ilyis]SEI53620.1 Predicted phospholipase, patatin/cPLA2 family [Trichococcus ilyis]
MEQNKEKVSLIIEGGAMRGVFCAGVISTLLREQIYLDYVIGVSSGSANGINYVSQDPARARDSFVDIAANPAFSGMKYFLNGQGYFNTKYIYEDAITNDIPFRFDSFTQNPATMKIVATEMETGKAVYFDKNEIATSAELARKVRASSTVPLVMPPTEIDGKYYLDGGIVDSLPIEKAIADGNRKHVIILTRPRGYIKEKQRFNAIIRRQLRAYPEIVAAIEQRHINYNRSMALIEQMEKEDKAFVFAPDQLSIGRMERNVQRLEAYYQYGERAAERQLPALQAFLSSR